MKVLKVSNVEKAVVKAIKDQKSGRNFGKVLNDVAKGFSACGFFEMDNWTAILNSSFNANAAINHSKGEKVEVTVEKLPPAASQRPIQNVPKILLQEPSSGIMTRQKAIAMAMKHSETADSKPGIIRRRATITKERVYENAPPNKFNIEHEDAKNVSVKERVKKSGKKNIPTMKCTVHRPVARLRSMSQEF